MNNRQRQEYKNWCDAMLKAGIIQDLIPGLALYLVTGARPGSFLTAVLCNNLMDAYAAGGDSTSFGNLDTLMLFLFNKVPANAVFSKDKFMMWKGGAEYVNR